MLVHKASSVVDLVMYNEVEILLQSLSAQCYTSADRDNRGTFLELWEATSWYVSSFVSDIS